MIKPLTVSGDALSALPHALYDVAQLVGGVDYAVVARHRIAVSVVANHRVCGPTGRRALEIVILGAIKAARQLKAIENWMRPCRTLLRG